VSLNKKNFLMCMEHLCFHCFIAPASDRIIIIYYFLKYALDNRYIPLNLLSNIQIEIVFSQDRIYIKYFFS